MAARVFVVNCGSSSLKYRVIDADGGEELAAGLAERIGEAGSRLVHDGESIECPLPDHARALEAVLARVETGALLAIAHRVVHGGARFSAPVEVDDGVLEEIKALSALAPLHNPVNVMGVEVARRALPDVPHVAIFDTAFHHTLPPHAATYAVPLAWASEHGVRRYGFHGTSHAYVARAAAALLERPVEEVDSIVLHLGNGASATAVQGGRSVETSMGMTPLEGLVMGTRCGDVDPALGAHLARVAGLDAAAVDRELNQRSGLLALAGANDMREVQRRAAAGDADAALALDVYCHRIRKYVGAYLAVLGGADAIVFTAGVGENDPDVRARCLSGLQRLGIVVDDARNRAASRAARRISADDAPVAVLVVPTAEELEMALQAAALVRARG